MGGGGSKPASAPLGSASCLNPGPNPAVVCTTLPALPGQQVLQVMPTVFGLATARQEVLVSSASHLNGMEQSVHAGAQALATEAQAQLAKQAAALGCNAVLNVHFNYGTSSTGNFGHFHLHVVDCYGTLKAAEASFLTEKTWPIFRNVSVTSPTDERACRQMNATCLHLIRS